MAYAICRDEKRLDHGDKMHVRVWLKGYAANAATMPPKRLIEAIEHLDAMIDDEGAGNDKLLDAAIAVASAYRDGIINADPDRQRVAVRRAVRRLRRVGGP